MKLQNSEELRDSCDMQIYFTGTKTVKQYGIKIAYGSYDLVLYHDGPPRQQSCIACHAETARRHLTVRWRIPLPTSVPCMPP